MADTKVSALTALGAVPADADLLYVVDDPSGSPVSKSVTVAELLGNVPRVIATASPSAASEVDFTLPSGYEIFEIRGWLVAASGNPGIEILFSTDGGSTFDTGASDYAHGADLSEMDATPAPTGFGDDADSRINFGRGGSTGANQGIHFRAQITRAHQANHAVVVGETTTYNGTNSVWTRTHEGGVHLKASACTDVRVRFAGGNNIADGELRLIGIP